MLIITTGRLKPSIKLFDNGWNYILHISFKLILFLAIWSWKYNNVLKKKVTSLRTLVIRVCQTTLHIFLIGSLKLVFENTRITVKRAVAQEDLHKISVHAKSHNIMYQIVNLEDITNATPLDVATQDTDPHLPTFQILVWRLKQGRKKGNAETPSPCWQYLMLHATKHCHNTSLQNSTRMLPSFLPLDEQNLCNDYIFMNLEYNNQLCFLNQVNSDTDMLDNVILHQVVIQPTKKPRNVSPHKLKSKTTIYKKKSYIKNKKLRSASTQLHRGSTEPNTNGINLLQHNLFYTNKALKNHTFIGVGTYTPIVTWKLTKNYSPIISDRPLLIVHCVFGTVISRNHQVYQ